MGDSAQRILLVEDDERLASLVCEFLQSNGYVVSIEGRGDRAVGRILDELPNLVILDLMLPGRDGLEVCREVRDHYPGVILMLTARGEDVDEIVGLEIGADDYIAKPVKPRVLLAHIKSQLRRAERLVDEDGQGRGDGAQRQVIGELVIDAGARTVQLGEQPIALTTAEFDLLWFLAKRAGEVVSRETIYSELRGIEYDGLDRSIDLRVARLRKKLGDDAKQPRLIKSVRGAGYLVATPSREMRAP
ncbi:MAG: DNA-binding response regulator [Proteobacteria bacterium]|nr:MAG: DNA-binding response regulator [Pseudomonadota bacterium]